MEVLRRYVEVCFRFQCFLTASYLDFLLPSLETFFFLFFFLISKPTHFVFFMQILIEDKHNSLVAVYTARLPAEMQVDVYARFLEGISFCAFLYP